MMLSHQFLWHVFCDSMMYLYHIGPLASISNKIEKLITPINDGVKRMYLWMIREKKFNFLIDVLWICLIVTNATKKPLNSKNESTQRAAFVMIWSKKLSLFFKSSKIFAKHESYESSLYTFKIKIKITTW